MARVLIVGCGCRGRALGRALGAAGHAVRGTTRSASHEPDIAAGGIEPCLADPDRVGTLIPALSGVTVMCLLLGSATGTPEQLEALHSTRLEMLLLRTIDTTVHAILYEATGTVATELLSRGASLVEAKCRHSGIRYAILRAEPDAFQTTALTAIERLLGPI